jgi:hypothetical protein
MIHKQLMRCVRCNALALFSPLDQTPEYRTNGERLRVLKRDDRASFMKVHRGHSLEELHVIEDSLISHQDYLEPMRTSYFEATNGKVRFVVKRFRRSVFDPMSYELIAGKLRLIPTKLSIDDVAIQRELERALSPLHLSSERIHGFVRQLDRIVSHLNPRDLNRTPFESHNPSVWYFTLDKAILDKVLGSCSRFLSKRERRYLHEFVLPNLEDELFMPMAKVDFRIESAMEEKQSEAAGS